jgi:hypothetical protein
LPVIINIIAGFAIKDVLTAIPIRDRDNTAAFTLDTPDHTIANPLGGSPRPIRRAIPIAAPFRKQGRSRASSARRRYRLRYDDHLCVLSGACTGFSDTAGLCTRS